MGWGLGGDSESAALHPRRTRDGRVHLAVLLRPGSNADSQGRPTPLGRVSDVPGWATVAVPRLLAGSCGLVRAAVDRATMGRAVCLRGRPRGDATRIAVGRGAAGGIPVKPDA